MATKPASRLLSIDALRGFDMLLISGGGSFIALMHGKTDRPWVDAAAAQLEHPAWNGFTFYDFIFPLFLFLAGVSLSFSLNKAKAAGFDNKTLYIKSFRRMVVLVFLGILFKNAPVPIWEPWNIRFVSVLGRIGFAGFITTLLYLNFNYHSRLVWITGILVLYYAVLFWIPVPGYGAGDLSFEGNLVGWFDRTFLPGRLLQGTYDELGLLTQFPALCLTMTGALAGELLQSELPDNRRVMILGLSGIGAIALGLLWGMHFPINKHLWTSSFILLTAGMALLFLAAFYGLIEVAGFRRWAFFFQVIGMNSLTIYFAYRFVNFRYTSRLLFEGIYRPLPEPWHEVLEAFGALALVWLFLYILYRQRIFWKI